MMQICSQLYSALKLYPSLFCNYDYYDYDDEYYDNDIELETHIPRFNQSINLKISPKTSQLVMDEVTDNIIAIRNLTNNFANEDIIYYSNNNNSKKNNNRKILLTNIVHHFKYLSDNDIIEVLQKVGCYNFIL